MLYVARGVALLISDGETFPNLGGTPRARQHRLHLRSARTVLGVPTPDLADGRCSRPSARSSPATPFGRLVYAIGGNERAALLAGVRVSRGQVARLHDLGRLRRAGRPDHRLPAGRRASGAGETFELNAIAAVVIGGTSLMGGRGTSAAR